MVWVETPSEVALSRLISMCTSGLVNFKLTSAIWNTGLALTLSMNSGRYFCRLSRLVACNTYWMGIPPRRPPKVDCC